MTRKDYVLIAAALNRVYENGNEDRQGTVRYVVATLAHSLKDDNPRFDTARFVRAATGA